MLDTVNSAHHDILLAERAIERQRFGIAKADSMTAKVPPFVRAWNLSHRRQEAITSATISEGVFGELNPYLFHHVYQNAGFRPKHQLDLGSDLNRWIWNTKQSFDAWQEDYESGRFCEVIPPLKARYKLARDVGARRMEFFNARAAEMGFRPLETLSDSYIERQTAGLRGSDVKALVMGIKSFVLDNLRKQPHGAVSIDRDFWGSVTEADKMALAHYLLEDYSALAVDKIQLARTKTPLAQGYYDWVGVGLAPQYSFFAFLRAYRHEVEGHARERSSLNPAFKYDLRGTVPGAGGDEESGLHAEYFKPVSDEFVDAVHCGLKEIMGDRFSHNIDMEREIRLGMLSQDIHDTAGEPSALLYPLNRYVFAAAESEMLDSMLTDNPIPIEDYPDVFAKHYEDVWGERLNREQAEKLLVSRFQSFVDYGRAHAYVAAIFAAADREMTIRKDGAHKELSLRRAWMHENIYMAAASLQFMDRVQERSGKPLDDRAFRELNEMHLTTA